MTGGAFDVAGRQPPGGSEASKADEEYARNKGGNLSGAAPLTGYL